MGPHGFFPKSNFHQEGISHCWSALEFTEFRLRLRIMLVWLRWRMRLELSMTVSLPSCWSWLVWMWTWLYDSSFISTWGTSRS